MPLILMQKYDTFKYFFFKKYTFEGNPHKSHPLCGGHVVVVHGEVRLQQLHHLVIDGVLGEIEQLAQEGSRCHDLECLPPRRSGGGHGRVRGHHRQLLPVMEIFFKKYIYLYLFISKKLAREKLLYFLLLH